MKHRAIRDPYGNPLNHKGLCKVVGLGVTDRIQTQQLTTRRVYSGLVAVRVGLVFVLAGNGARSPETGLTREAGAERESEEVAN